MEGSPDPWSDNMARSAALMLDCPIAIVSIVDRDRQWFLGSEGLDILSTPREQAFCAYTILSDEPLIVPDAAADPRFADNPLVTEPPHIRFYAGVPVRDESGHAIGSLCVIDTKPREMDDRLIQGLGSLGELVSSHVATAKRHRATLSASLDAIITIDAEGTVTEFNEPAGQIFGYEVSDAIGSPLAELIVPPSLRDAHRAGMKRYLATGEGPVLGQRIEITAMRSDGTEFPVELTISPVTIDGKQSFTAFIRDLSETHELNAALRLTRFTVENAPDAMFWVAPDASFADVNAAACESLGYTREELLGMRVFDIDGTMFPEAWDRHWADLAKKGELVVESRHVRRDGSSFPVEVSCNFLQHEGRELNCVIARDMTDRRAAELALSRSEARFRDIASATGECVWETNTEGAFTYLSDAFEAQLGRPAAEAIGGSIFECYESDSGTRLRALFERAYSERLPFRNSELRAVHADGGQRWQRLTGKAVFDPGGRHIGFRGMALDVTSFKLAGERQRRVSEFQSLARSVISMFLDPSQFEIAIATILARGGRFFGASQGVALEWQGESWALVEGWRSDPASETPWVDASDLSEEDGLIATTMYSGEGAPFLLTITVPVDGGRGWLLRFARETPFEPLDDGLAELVLSVSTGLGHAVERVNRKLELERSAQRLEEALKEAQAANDAKTSFLAHMSHEIRTPLTAVLGFSRILRSGNQETQTQSELLEKIDSNGRSLLSIINTILDLSKIESGRASARLESTSMRSVLTLAGHAVAGTAADKALAFEIHVGEGVPESIRSDQIRLVQILTNLLSNAVKYTDRGRFDLYVYRGEDTGDGTLRFTIRDTGPGIAPDHLDRVFDAFDRAAASGDGGGTGLGLAIVGKLVSLLGGEVRAESEVGSGSTFTFWIPLLDPSEAALDPGRFELGSGPSREDQDATTSRLDGMRVMLVEDSEHVREVVEYFLRDRGAQVRICRHGGEAVEALLEHGETPDIILMDMQMPVMDGYEATRRLRLGGMRRPIIALTAHGLQHERDRCLAAGCDDYISKPVDPEILAGACLRLFTPRPDQERVEPRADTEPDPVPSSMADLQQRFRLHLRDELDYLCGPARSEAHDAVRRRVHKLAGAAGNLGFPGTTEAARAAEKTIHAGGSDEEILGALDALADVIREELRADR